MCIRDSVEFGLITRHRLGFAHRLEQRGRLLVRDFRAGALVRRLTAELLDNVGQNFDVTNGLLMELVELLFHLAIVHVLQRRFVELHSCLLYTSRCV